MINVKKSRDMYMCFKFLTLMFTCVALHDQCVRKVGAKIIKVVLFVVKYIKWLCGDCDMH